VQLLCRQVAATRRCEGQRYNGNFVTITRYRFCLAERRRWMKDVLWCWECSPQAPGTIPPSRRSPNTLHSIAKPISHCEPRPYRLRSSRSLVSLSAIDRESTLTLDYTPLRRSHRERWRARDLYSARPTQLQPTRQARHTSCSAT
jgi:hypothetical protein